MSTRFWSSPGARWRLARFAVMALAGCVALPWIVGELSAIAFGMVVSTFLLFDEVHSRRTRVIQRGSGASA